MTLCIFSAYNVAYLKIGWYIENCSNAMCTNNYTENIVFSPVANPFRLNYVRVSCHTYEQPLLVFFFLFNWTLEFQHQPTSCSQSHNTSAHNVFKEIQSYTALLCHKKGNSRLLVPWLTPNITNICLSVFYAHFCISYIFYHLNNPTDSLNLSLR